MLAQWSAIRNRDGFWRFDDEKTGWAGINVNTVGRPLGNDDIIARLVREYSIIRFESPAALMHKVQFIPISIANEMTHRFRTIRYIEADILAVHCKSQLRVPACCREMRASKGSRLQRPVNLHP